MANARAYIAAGDTTLVMPVNPYTAQWGYKENAVSYDTLGGRVVQLLSVQITGLSIESVAGSRRDLQKVAESVRQIMDYHIKTLRPATFVVPSRKWNFRVYLTAMPQMGWDLAATTYPYSFEFQVDEDISGVKTRQVEEAALERLFQGVGYNKSFHGGDAKGFDKIVKTVMAAAALGGIPSGGSGGGGGGQGDSYGGSSKWNPDIANAPWEGNTIKDQIYNCFRAVFGSAVARRMTCIAERESGYRPDAFNTTGYTDPSGNHHWVYGLFQISDIHRANSWWPPGVAPGNASRSQAQPSGGLLYNAEYNTKCAMQMYKGATSSGGADPWASTSGSCA